MQLMQQTTECNNYKMTQRAQVQSDHVVNSIFREYQTSCESLLREGNWEASSTIQLATPRSAFFETVICPDLEDTVRCGLVLLSQLSIQHQFNENSPFSEPSSQLWKHPLGFLPLEVGF